MLTAETARILVKDNRGKEQDKGWTCDLVPKPFVVTRAFAQEQEVIDSLASELESVTARRTELEEEHGGEDGAFAELEKINRASVAARRRELRLESEELNAKAAGIDPDQRTTVNAQLNSEAAVLMNWLKLAAEEADLKKRLRKAEAELDAQAYAHYPNLIEDEIKWLVVDDKWLAVLDAAIHGEMDRVSQQLTQRVKELAERYETPMPELTDRVVGLEEKVNRHLERMGFGL